MSDREHDSSERWSEEAAAAAAAARGRLRARFVLLLAAFVIVWTFGEGVTIWNHLPERIPTHFSFGGEPDAWGGKGVFSVFGLLIVAAAVLLLVGVLALVRFNPRYWNVPRKEFLMGLPSSLQDRVTVPIREGTAWLAASIAIGFSLGCRQSWAVALERRDAVSPSLMLITIAIGVAAVIIGMVCYYREIRKLEEAS